jgi:predicted DNA-binding protein (MmcQ/YjbR family)
MMHPLKLKIIDYCLSLPYTEECFPFDTKTWVAKAYGKMFALTDVLDDDVRINLKCDPERAEELRAEYDFVLPGYHMSKKHWNTIYCNLQPLEWMFLKELIDHSYAMVLKTIPKSQRL